MLPAPRHAAALLAVLLLPALPNLGPSAQAGLIHLGEPYVQINGDQCQLVLLNDPLKQDPSVWEGSSKDNLPLPEVVALLSLPLLPESAGSSTASSNPGPSTGSAVLLAAGQQAPSPALAAYLVAGDQLFIPDPAHSSLFRPPRSVRLG